MKRCGDTACLDRYDGAVLMSLESFRACWRCSERWADRNGIRHPWRRATLGAWKGAVGPSVLLGECRRSCGGMDGCHVNNP